VVLTATSELGQLGERSRDPGLLRAEIHQHGDVGLDSNDHAETVAVMRHLVIHGVLLDWPGRRPVIEGAAGQITPVHGAGRIHHLYYASLQLRIAHLLSYRRTARARNFRPDGFSAAPAGQLGIQPDICACQDGSTRGNTVPLRKPADARPLSFH
jgi:hypothetical protein